MQIVKTYYKIGENGDWVAGKGKKSTLYYELTQNGKVNEEDKELWDGTIGGSVVFSCNGEKLGVQNDEDPAKAALFDKYNWPSCEFWGVLDEELLGPVGEGSTYDDTKPG